MTQNHQYFKTRIESLTRRAWGPSSNETTPWVMDGLFAQLLEECGELRSSIRDLTGRSLRPDKPLTTTTDVMYELGDVLVVLNRIALLYDLNPDTCMDLALAKFESRLTKLGL